ncbi:MAG: ATP-dependent DNA helicase RecG, partial [Lachnospiraceae bacterium]|nr:ATP-dependent DNA helicase RecG [Lachnospiraceae bacterium]
IETGEANVVIGTHALIQEKVNYNRLALVITDEQHRFGVRQREILSEKGGRSHVLVMSATPIPRTLAIILYGDMHLSVVDELPAGRIPIKNCVVGTSYRKKAYEFIEKEVEKGNQAYVICPMVEADENSDSSIENVTDYGEKLRNHLPKSVHVEILHGKMKPADKKRIMEAFAAGDVHVLVSTTVIEVGINVPAATVMMIENAERFGLAQLHQLRGRIGRGKEQSYCIFLNASDKEQSMDRLKILNKSNDGFYIAEEDLKLRGPGDLFGIRQSGEMEFKIADIYQDAEILKKISVTVDGILAKDRELAGEKYASLKRYLDENTGNFIDFRTI